MGCFFDQTIIEAFHIGLFIPLLFAKVKYFSRKKELELEEEKINLVKT